MKFYATLLTGLLMATPAALLRAEDPMTHDAEGKKHGDVTAMQKELGLSDEQVANFKKIMATERDGMKSLIERRMQAMKKLEEQVNNKAPDAEIKVTLDEIKSVRKAILDQVEQIANQKDDILTPTQRAKLMLKRRGMMQEHREEMMLKRKPMQQEKKQQSMGGY